MWLRNSSLDWKAIGFVRASANSKEKTGKKDVTRLSNENEDDQLWFCLRKKPRIHSVSVNCVYVLFELFEASKYSKNMPSVNVKVPLTSVGNFTYL